MTKITYIPGEIVNAASDEHGNRKPVTRTQHIFDDAKGKNQQDINEDIYNLILSVKEVREKVKHIFITQSAYDALETYEKDTLYLIVEYTSSGSKFGEDTFPLILS